MATEHLRKRIIAEVENSFLPTQAEVRADANLLDELFIEGAEKFRVENLQPGSRYYEAVENGQHPLAVIVKCVDSRYPAEIVLSLPVGTILTHKSVGGLIRDFDAEKEQPDSEWVTMLFGVRELGAPCVVRKGHTSCGCADKLFDHYVQTKKSEPNAFRSETIVDPLKRWINHALPLAERVIGDAYLNVPRARLIRMLEEEMVRDDVRKIAKGFERMIELGILSPDKKPTIMGSLYEMSSATMYKLYEDGHFKLSYEPVVLPEPQREPSALSRSTRRATPSDRDPT